MLFIKPKITYHKFALGGFRSGKTLTGKKWKKAQEDEQRRDRLQDGQTGNRFHVYVVEQHSKTTELIIRMRKL